MNRREGKRLSKASEPVEQESDEPARRQSRTLTDRSRDAGSVRNDKRRKKREATCAALRQVQDAAAVGCSQQDYARTYHKVSEVDVLEPVGTCCMEKTLDFRVTVKRSQKGLENTKRLKKGLKVRR